MTDKELQEILYDSFFDELHNIEKEAMKKEAILGAIGQGAKALTKLKPATSAKMLQSAYRGGSAAAAKGGAGRVGQFLGGAKQVLKNPMGQAAAAGVAGVGAVGAGGIAAGSALGGRRRR